MIRMVAQRDETAMAEASAWLARLQSADVCEADGVAFDAWLEAAPENRTAYTHALSLWHEYEAKADDVAEALTSARPQRRRGLDRRWIVGGLGAALAASLAVAILPGVLAQTETQVFATTKGEHRRVTLSDGSVIDMDADTRLTVALERRARRVTLAEGEAIFDVAHDTKRPFTVAAANRQVRVVGTQFDVRSRGGELAVTVARGKVQVAPADPAATGRKYLLTPGLRLAIDRSGAENLRSVDPQEAFGWRVGRLVYREQPLADVVADINRQFAQQIEIGDPELGRIPITGVIILDDPHAVATRLSLMLPIRSVPSDRGLLLLRK